MSNEVYTGYLLLIVCLVYLVNMKLSWFLFQKYTKNINDIKELKNNNIGYAFICLSVFLMYSSFSTILFFELPFDTIDPKEHIKTAKLLPYLLQPLSLGIITIITSIAIPFYSLKFADLLTKGIEEFQEIVEKKNIAVGIYFFGVSLFTTVIFSLVLKTSLTIFKAKYFIIK